MGLKMRNWENFQAGVLILGGIKSWYSLVSLAELWNWGLSAKIFILGLF